MWLYSSLKQFQLLTGRKLWACLRHVCGGPVSWGWWHRWRCPFPNIKGIWLKDEKIFKKRQTPRIIYVSYLILYHCNVYIYILYYRYVSKYIHKGLQQKWCLKAQFFGFLEWRPPFNFQLVVETGCGTCIEYFSIPPFCWYEKIIQTTFFIYHFLGFGIDLLNFLRPQKSNIDINNCSIFQGSPPFPNHHFGYPFVTFRSWDSFTEKTRRRLASPCVTPNFFGVRKAVLNGTPPPKLKTYIWGSS